MREVGSGFGDLEFALGDKGEKSADEVWVQSWGGGEKTEDDSWVGLLGYE